MKTLVYKDITYAFKQVASTANGATVLLTISAPMPVFNTNGIAVVFNGTIVENKLFYARYVDGDMVYAYPDKRATHIDGTPASGRITEPTRDVKQQIGTSYSVEINLPIDRGDRRYKELDISVALIENNITVVSDKLLVTTSKVKETILNPIKFNLTDTKLTIHCSYDNNENFFDNARLFIDDIYSENFIGSLTKVIDITENNKGTAIKFHYTVEARDKERYRSENIAVAIPATVGCWYKTATGWKEVDKIFYCPTVNGVFKEISSGEYNSGRWSTLSK